jgi:hypothetical protein
LGEQNEIARLLSGECSCDTIDELPEPIRRPVKELFKSAFDLLTPLGLRAQHYALIFESIPYAVCPFCGCEPFDAPGGVREDLDHYLVRSKYPFAAANLHNLVPMGKKCNSYKLTKDILFKEDGTRRRAFYPYSHTGIRISLERSEPFAGTEGVFPVPLWRIDFEPDSEEVSTWDEVFYIRERYTRDVLDPEFFNWLRGFSSWCRRNYNSLVSTQDRVDEIERYSKFWETEGMGDRAFLKAAVFQMLFYHCRQGNERLMTLLKGVVIGEMH